MSFITYYIIYILPLASCLLPIAYIVFVFDFLTPEAVATYLLTRSCGVNSSPKPSQTLHKAVGTEARKPIQMCTIICVNDVVCMCMCMRMCIKRCTRPLEQRPESEYKSYSRPYETNPETETNMYVSQGMCTSSCLPFRSSLGQTLRPCITIRKQSTFMRC